MQGALTEVLQAIYEQDFSEDSYGFRPRRSAHDALRAVDAMVYREGAEWILEADIQAFLDTTTHYTPADSTIADPAQMWV